MTAPATTTPGVPASLRSLRFAALLVGEAINNLGGWATLIALLGFAAYRFDASPYRISLLVLCWAAPPALLSPLLGTHIDRVGPRRALIVAYLTAAGIAVAMAGATSYRTSCALAVFYGATVPCPVPLPTRSRRRCSPPISSFAATHCWAQLASPPHCSARSRPRPATGTLGLRGAFHRRRQLRDRGCQPPASTFPSDPAATTAAVPAGTDRRLSSCARRCSCDGWSCSASQCRSRPAHIVVEPLYTRTILHRPPSQFALFEGAAGAGAVLGNVLLARARQTLPTSTPATTAILYGLAGFTFVGTRFVPVAYLGAIS